MTAYPDTSFLYGIYLVESHSQAAAAHAATMTESLHISGLLRYEFRQSLRFQVWRRTRNPNEGITAADAQKALDQLEADLISGVVLLVPCNLLEVIRLADEISQRYTITGGHRSLDILHVAAALVLEAEELLSFDERQRRLAVAEGLKVKP